MLGSEKALLLVSRLSKEGKPAGYAPLAAFLQVAGIVPASLSWLTDATLVL